ncbi:protein disulfide-isomerase [Acrasis kona]|uniref:Protein disulfide-isomerase n=1 Tax=Acrasis kona TaxID=1008807 RepID=A0AAW2YII4_9EUKA
MKLVAIVLLAAILAFCNAKVVELDNSNFDTSLSSNPYTLVMFYAPWCGHCKKLHPEFEALADSLKEAKNVTIATLDCDKDQNKALAERYEIQGFPTVKLFKGGEVYRDYEGDRTKDAILNWVNKKTGPVAKIIASVEELKDFLSKTKESATTAVVGFFSNKDSESYKTFLKNAADASLEDFSIAEVVGLGDKVKEYLTDSKDEAVSVFRHFADEAVHTFDYSNLVNFTRRHGYPLVDELSGKSFQRFVNKNLPIAILFVDPEQDNKEVIKGLTPTAESLLDKVAFAYSDGKTYGEQLTLMGGDSNSLPALALMKLDKKQNYPFFGDVNNSEEITQWANEILSGKVEPYLRSGPIPETNDEPVKVVVGKTYESIVLDPTKDVLLEFYAPWCGHCKSLEPKYNKLAQSLSHVENLVIAKIDATENDTPVSVEGFPTLILFPATDKLSPITYEGARTPKDILRFLKKNATVSKDNIKPLQKSEQKDEL